jgi:HlyD family secretion protein
MKYARPLLAGCLALSLAGCNSTPHGFQGWIEADTIFMGPDDTGRLVDLAVSEGQDVKAGDFLFAIDSQVQAADVEAAQASLDQARARLARLEAAQQRPEEVAVLEASRNQARAALDFSTSELARVRALIDKAISTRQQLDQAQANYDRDRAALENVTRQIEVARMSGRSEDIDAARFAVQQAKAQLDNSLARKARTRVSASATGRITEVYYRTGEIVPPGKAVVSLLPPGNLKVRFFVPQSVLPTLKIGSAIAVSCDGCTKNLMARITFISQTAEFTPPVIYSLEERQKLVFKIEAVPEQPDLYRVGQPISVDIAP